MLMLGQVLYDANEHEVVVTKVMGNSIYATLKRKVHVTYNLGKVSKESVITEEIKFYDNEIGIKYFYGIIDYQNHKDLIIEDSRYDLNKDRIIEFFREKNLSKLNEILKYAPIGPVLTENMRERILTLYYSEDEQMKQEMDFHEKNPDCFGRIDTNTEFYIENFEKYHRKNYYDVIYINKGDYQQIGDKHIVNWRAPIASLYYDNEKSEMKSQYYIDVFNTISYINGRTPIETGSPGTVYDYSLLLKRRYQFNPFFYRNLFIGDDLFFSEGSADSFLMNIIAEKRADHKLTDIIKTIQSNQNKMIRHNHKKNMIVQGCAGSGKTMILLHRISYLKYNNLILNLDKAVIITPNDNFSMFISELAESLELERVKRLTLSQYYLSMISEYQAIFPVYVPGDEKDSKNSTYTVRENKKANTIISEIVGSFYNKKPNAAQNHDKYYSHEFIIRLYEHYKKSANKLLEDIHYSDICMISDRINFPNTTTENVSNEDLDKLYAYCNGLLLQKYNTLLSETQNNLSRASSEMRNWIEKYSESNKAFDEITETHKIFSLFLRKVKEFLDLKQAISFNRNKQSELTIIMENQSLDSRTVDNEIEKLKDYIQNLLKMNFLIRLVNGKGLRENKRQLDNLHKKQHWLIESNSKIDSELAQLNSKLIVMEKKCISLESGIDKDIEDNIIAEMRDFYIEITESKYKTKQENELLIKYKDAYDGNMMSEIIYELNNKNYSNNILKNSQEFYNKVEILLKEAMNTRDNIKSQFENAKANEKEAKFRLEHIHSLYPNEEERKIMEDAALYLTKRGMFVLETFKSFMNITSNVSKKDYNKLAEEKHEIFILLYFYYLHCGSISSIYQYIFIDEGQDYAEEEYSLMCKISKEKCLFEVYGDSNQCITKNRGITDWKLLKYMFDADYFELNENYRNTVEIADFINNKLKFTFTSIGIHGPAVIDIKNSDLEFLLLSEFEENQQNRIAVICKDNLVIDKIKANVSLNDSDRVVFENVIGVKGLEFDTVFVIFNNMDRNESYIAFSRALNKLYVLSN